LRSERPRGGRGELPRVSRGEGTEHDRSYLLGLAVNVIGSVLGLKHGIKALRKRGGGSLILNSSQGGGASRGLFSGVIGDLTMINQYCLTSAAIDQLVRMAAYYQNENIRVYGLKPAVFKSDMSDQWVQLGRETGFNPDMNDEILADFNFFFKGIIGDPKHIGYIVETLVNNTTKYVPGSNISLDNDATYDASLTYAVCDTDTLTPEITLEDLRGYDGGDYESKDERTAAFIANLN
jgi:NAD(P)-dependent dehydrogenase (short-subunit alcohol dehydrogenase family)